MEDTLQAPEMLSSGDFESFVRNRYFYGKLMDVRHFEMEQSYWNRKHSLQNRTVSGYGVICGLNVVLTDDLKSIRVEKGLAIDKAGRDIVVPAISRAYLIPEAPHPEHASKPGYGKHNCDEEGYAHIAISYRECLSDPEPVRAGDCNEPDPCAPGSIREGYEISFLPWKSPKIHLLSNIQDLITGGRLNYDALANHITRNCATSPANASIPLANIRLPQPGATVPPEQIDITIRPIVYTNDLLFELILAFLSQSTNHPRPNK